jgi:hypothetical protein
MKLPTIHGEKSLIGSVWHRSNERKGGMMRTASALAAGLMAMVGLVQPALASREQADTARAANTPSTTLGGLDFNNYIGVPGAVSAIIVVPKLSCAGTPTAGSAVYVGVGIASVNSYARLYVACTPKGVARYYPSLLVNGTVENVPGKAARAGDTIQFAVSQSVSKVTISVIDVTHGWVVSHDGSGSGTGQGITAGDFPVLSGSTASAVPNFGTLAFSSAVINGYPFGLAGTGLQAADLSTSSDGPIQIKTVYSAGKKEAFATVFKHS